jgi:hypothetical protein
MAKKPSAGSVARSGLAFVASAVVYFALATMNAWPNIEAAMHGDARGAALAFAQYTFAFIVAISSVASASHEKGGQLAVVVFMIVNGYFAYDASSHRHDEAHTTVTRKAIVGEELKANNVKLGKLGEFDRVSAEQIKAAEEKVRIAEEATRCWATCTGTKASRAKAVKTAQDDLDRLLPLRKKTEDAEKLEDAIIKGNAELKSFKATGDSDLSLASMAGANTATLTTTITLLLALGIELANKYGPCWTFRFLMGNSGAPAPAQQRARVIVQAKPKRLLSSILSAIIATPAKAEPVVSYPPGSAREFYRRYLVLSDNPADKIPAGNIQKRYAEDCDRLRVDPLNPKAFSRSLQEIAQYAKTAGGRPYYHGVKWRDVPLPAGSHHGPRMVVNNTLASVSA